MSSSIQNLAIALLKCHRTIAPEAASVFYGKNMFSFIGAHEYLPIITWLDQISEQYRGYLTSLEMTMWRPSKAWQLPGGTRLTEDALNGYSFRHPHLAAPSTPCPEGEVDIVNPAIETIIQLLARSNNDKKLTLYLNLAFDTIPGIELILEREDAHLFSMDLPNLIEKWRTDYSSGTLEVLWRTEAYREPFLQNRKSIEDLGWEIVEEKQAERFRLASSPEPTAFPTMRLLLKRTKLTAPPLAADPDPYSWITRRYYM